MTGVSEVRIAGAGDAAEVARILTAGFLDDPVMCWVFDEPGREAKLRAFFDFVVREALVPLGATYVLDGSCANWTPPGSPDWPEERSARFAELLSGACTDEERERLGVVDRTMQQHHPRVAHWYLGSIATEPAAQGRGLGSMLLRESLARVDHEGLPAYLESTNPRNVTLYERHGFQVTDSVDLPDGPSLTLMWRDPAG